MPPPPVLFLPLELRPPINPGDAHLHIHLHTFAPQIACTGAPGSLLGLGVSVVPTLDAGGETEAREGPVCGTAEGRGTMGVLPGDDLARSGLRNLKLNEGQ